MTRPLLGLRILLLPVLLLTRPVAAQCSQSQGDATLDIGGLPQIGSSFRVTVSGQPLAPFLLAASTDPAPQAMAGGTVCLGPNPRVLLNGIGYLPGQPPPNPAFRIPPTGAFRTDLTIPDAPALVGMSFYFQAIVADPSSPTGSGYAISNQVARTIEGPSGTATIWFEDFEAGWGNWWATNGTWEIGVPTTGPAAAWSGSSCAATTLGGYYPKGTTTRLVSEPIPLPAIGPNEEIRLTYRTWFSLASYDNSRVQVSVDNGLTWQNPPGSSTLEGWGSDCWTQAGVDLSSFAGQTILLGLYLYSHSQYNSWGTYIDDLRVFRGTPYFRSPEDWEAGIGSWWTASRGTWQVGVPTAGPTSVPSGTQCLGTFLDGLYPKGTSTRFESAPVDIPASASPSLRFEHWFSFASYDYGDVLVSTDNGVSWTSLLPGQQFVGGSNGIWTPAQIDLSAYAGTTVRLAFYLYSHSQYNGQGWFIDDLHIQ